MNRNNYIKAVLVCVALILVLVILYSGLRVMESTVFFKQQDGEALESKWITRDGVSYFPRQDITVIMLLGIDREGKLAERPDNSGYAADMIALLVFDEQTQKCSILTLNRDMMVMMPGLNAQGVEDGAYYTQLALSHTFGSGLEDSCENTRKTVSDLLYGINIDHYISMNMDAVAILNDAVGGVPVNVVDDFSQVDPTIIKGALRLRGRQAIHFVRLRKGVGDQLNITRMERQKEFFGGFLEAFREKLAQDDGFLVTAYEQASPYIVTDCSLNAISGMVQRYSDYELGEILSPEGENTLSDGHYEFYADEASLDDLIIRLFYAPRQ